MKRVLIANRGEIACRIIRACKELGLETVAVFSDADANSLHVAMADASYHVGPSPSAASYLNVDRILEAARHTRADALHPGYGFLSESTDLARRAELEGLIWVGPSLDSLRAMGDKQRARCIAQAAGVPVLPGSRRFDMGELDGLEEAAEAVGFPLLVKATGGGGGIGMRRIDSIESLRPTVEATQILAQKNFGDGTIYLERFISMARHIEVQVFGYGARPSIHLMERECSVQRRFQKIVEESPAPSLPNAVRARMTEAAVALATAQHYRGAGTVEFVCDAGSSEFYFLEMNTRIQVEHPVTEMTTGCDLVREQLRFAGRVHQEIDQADVVPKGVAIECRIYAENPKRSFAPSPGKLTRFLLPQGMSDVRIETGYREGDVVTPYYDPLLAKVIGFGLTRSAARRTLLEALAECRIGGVHNNVEFLRAVIRHPRFVAGQVDTNFVDRELRQLTAEQTAPSALARGA